MQSLEIKMLGNSRCIFSWSVNQQTLLLTGYVVVTLADGIINLSSNLQVESSSKRVKQVSPLEDPSYIWIYCIATNFAIF